MVDYTDDDLQRALGIVRSLGSAEGPRLGELEDGLSVVDLQSSAEQFYNDLSLIEDFGLDFPALFLAGERRVPVALSEIMHGFFPFGPYYLRDFPRVRSFREEVYEELRRWRARSGVTTLSPDEARNTFISLASEFLASRFAGRRMAAAGTLNATIYRRTTHKDRWLSFFRSYKHTRTLCILVWRLFHLL